MARRTSALQFVSAQIQVTKLAQMAQSTKCVVGDRTAGFKTQVAQFGQSLNGLQAGSSYEVAASDVEMFEISQPLAKKLLRDVTLATAQIIFTATAQPAQTELLATRLPEYRFTIPYV